MARRSLGRKTLWQYSHSASILFAVLLFTAGFLCTLLWTNSLVETETSATGPYTSTFNQFSPAVSTFSMTYQVVGVSESLRSSQADIIFSIGNLWYSMECDTLRYPTNPGTRCPANSDAPSAL